MKLPLVSEGDHNGNAFPISSSSSSSSSSCLGESSPESLRSLSSLTGARTDSPLDYDMLEVTVVTTVMTKTNKMTDDVSNWGPEEESNPDDNDDVSVGKIQTATELTESNDNSVSVYVDANSEYLQDPWNDNLTLALSLTTNKGSCGNNDDFSSRSGNGKRHGSSTPDSDCTEIPADDDDYEEDETLFLSVSSDVGVCRSSINQTSSTRQSSGSSAVTNEPQTEGTVALIDADHDQRSELVFKGLEVACVESQTDAPASEDLGKTIQRTSPSASPTHDAKAVTSPPPEGAERHVGPKAHISQPVRAAKTKSTTASSPAPQTGMSIAVGLSGLEIQRVFQLEPKIVKAKSGSRSTQSPSKTPSQVLQTY